MTDNIMLSVVTPEKSVINEEVKIVMAPGSEGEFGVLEGHTPFLTILKVGTLRYTDVDGNERYVFINSGFAEALPDKVTILAESAERRSDIDAERAQAALERAQERIEEKKGETDIDFVRAKAALERAVHRLNLAKTAGK